MTYGFTILLLSVAILIAGVVLNSWRSQQMLCVPLPRPYRRRDGQEAKWRQNYPGQMQHVDALLELVCEAFCFNPDHRYQFAPTDRILDVHRACHPRWQFWNFGDSMEIESLMIEVNKFGVADDIWDANITLGEIVDSMKSIAPSRTGPK